MPLPACLQQTTTSDFDDQFWNNGGTNVGTWVMRDALVLLCFDMATGNLDYAMPIWGQLGGFSMGNAAQHAYSSPSGNPLGAPIYLTVSKSDQDAVYLATKVKGALVFGNAFNFQTSDTLSQQNYYNLNGQTTPTGLWSSSGVGVSATIKPQLANQPNEYPTVTDTVTEPYQYKSSYALIHISSGGSTVVGATYDINKYFAAPTLPETRTPSMGTWTGIQADNSNGNVFVVGSFDGSQNTLVVGAPSTQSGISGTRNAMPDHPAGSPTTSNPYSLLYDSSDAFIATFTSQCSPTGTPFIIRGLGDSPAIGTGLASDSLLGSDSTGRLYAVVTFKNVTYFDQVTWTGGDAAPGVPSTSVSNYATALSMGTQGTSYALLQVSSSLTYGDNALLHSMGSLNIKGTGGNGGTFYVVAEFNDEIALEIEAASSSSSTNLPLSVYPRAGTNNFVFITNAAIMPTDEGSEVSVTGYEDRRYQLRIGLGVGIGLGGGLIFVTLVVLIFIAMKRSSGGASSAGKVIASPV